MSYTLSDFKYPDDWFFKPADDKPIYDCYKELLDMNIFNKDEKTFTYYYGTMSSSLYLYPNCNYDQVVIATRYLTICFMVDDFLENRMVDDDEARVLIKKLEHIFIHGEIQNEINKNKIEDYCLFFRNTTKQYVINQNGKIPMFTQFMKHLIDWINSINPFNRATNLLSYDSYNFFKRINSGTVVSLSLYFVLYPTIDVDIDIWLNPLFDRYTRYGGYQMATLNDAASYAKEVRYNNHLTNPLHFLQRKYGSFDGAYKAVIKFNDEIMDQILKDEEDLLKQFSYDEKKRKDLKLITQSMKDILGGNYLWSIQCSRYKCLNSPFKEQVEHDKDVVSYVNVVNNIYFKN